MRVGETGILTTGIDTLVGTDGNDTFNAVIAKDSTGAATTAETFTALDNLDGGKGIDTLNISNISDVTKDKTDLSVVTLANIETINIQSAGDISSADASNTAVTDNVDFSTIAGLTTLNTTKSINTLVKAAATTDVNVSNATGIISVLGGKDITVTDATAGKAISIGNAAATTGSPAGKITVTDTDNSGANAITVTGGTDVTITTTADKADANDIAVGHATNGQATGAVVVTQNTTSDATVATITAGDVDVIGGSTVEITANMTNTAVKAGTSGQGITAGEYTVTGGNTTTSVTITQNATATNFASDAAAMVKETSVVTFNNMKSGETLIVNGLTFTAAKALTAAEAAAAFANLTAADTQSATGITGNGIYTGKFNTAVWTSSAANGSTVTFTAQDDDETDLVFTGTAATNNSGVRIPTQVKTTGTPAAASTAVNVTADLGDVVVDDNATKSITTITLNGYDTATLGAGGSGSLNALTTLNLSNSAGANALTTTATTLTANLDGITGSTDLGGSVATLTVNTSGTASSTALTAGALKDLTVNAAANLIVTPTSIGNLETLTVTGAANVTMGDISAKTTTITAGTATGDISASVDGDIATVATGSGNDTITLLTTTVFDEDIDLGAGDDTLVLTADTTVLPTGTVDGGADTDTISMTSTSALSYHLNSNFANAITSFERLVLSDRIDVEGDVTIDMEKLGFSYVTLAGGLDDSGATAETLILDNLANNGTVVLLNTMDASAAQSDLQVNVKDAATTTATLNIIANAEDALDVGSVTADDVESFTITANDINADALANGGVVLAMLGDAVTTITVKGDADLDLTTTAANLETVTATALTGGLTYTIANVANDFLLQSGSGKDNITVQASNNAQVKAGDGDDKIILTADAVSANIWGGNGNDTFDVTNTISSATQYATIEDATSGDVIKLGTTHFLSGSVSITDFDQMTLTDKIGAVLGDTGLNTGTDFAISFQNAGNTYIVVSDGTAGSSFGAAGTDQVIKLTGLYNFSTDASFNSTDGTLEIA